MACMSVLCRYLRPDVPTEQAIVALLDVRGVLYELRVQFSPPSRYPLTSVIKFESQLHIYFTPVY